jgi:hypothetical protein
LGGIRIENHSTDVQEAGEQFDEQSKQPYSQTYTVVVEVKVISVLSSRQWQMI